MKTRSLIVITLTALTILFILDSCSNSGNTLASVSTIDSLRKQIKDLTAGNDSVNKHLVKFDTLDFVVFSQQQWVRFHETHSKDIIVNWPDGHHTTGLERHIEDMKAMFVYAPNTNIKIHPIRFGSGEWTCVTGVMTGTFTKPMPIGGGKFIQPTGKSFSIPMCTVGHWKNGLMVEESLFWDNQTYMTQMGLGK
ncbi:MAG: ester cyclase [Candidatus Pedobacter colombiensis]|uniref:Ester cyclase n=1 Tax=Candidatus Pedobacter colombiensis TaxID=3121371 RepID=A0AAJ5WBK8_9SPHI|nr:ester cyclase [Pedobacter sp.]WEK21606.1 MAG: ester cyclase [Pedobacter sp.]